jgi:hypothetical protein
MPPHSPFLNIRLSIGPGDRDSGARHRTGEAHFEARAHTGPEQ